VASAAEAAFRAFLSVVVRRRLLPARRGPETRDGFLLELWTGQFVRRGVVVATRVS
jgi:hypothetical protein